VEQMLAGLFSELLAVPTVGRRDNFFDLGGNSILAMRVLFRIRQALGNVLSLQTLFEAPSIAELVQAMRSDIDVPGGARSTAHNRLEWD
jgi:aryl carrier-like protein